MSSLSEKCARMFMVGFAGPALDSELDALIEQGVFGAIAFARNVGGAEQTRETVGVIKRRAGRPFLLGVDQEGGRVARLRGAPFTALPTMRELGARGDEALARRAGQLLAFELRAVGFDWDFAPVLDVDTNPKNPVIADRAFHSRSGEVARLGVALAQGLESGGVASCGKHFPGHGDTSQDSHRVLPRLSHDMARLREVELCPFRGYSAARLAAIMTAHIIFESVDASAPATMSRAVLDGILRKELGFEGVIVSDDLEMKAIADGYSMEEAVTLGANAGVDLFLVCCTAKAQFAAIEGLIKAAESGRVPRERIEEANRRLDGLAARFANAPSSGPSQLAGAMHQHLAEGFGAAVSGRDPTSSEG